MQIEPISPEVISLDDYHPTSNPRLFIHADNGTAVFVGQESAVMITLPQV